MKNPIAILACAVLAVATLLVFTGCNTAKGIGQDIEAAGGAISSGAQSVQSGM